MRHGIPVSPGIAVGAAYCLDEVFVPPERERLEHREISAELARYETACDETESDLRELKRKVVMQVGEAEGAIFAVHESILRDSTFRNKIRTSIIDERLTAQAALQRAMNEYTSLFARTKDHYLKERLTDVRDVVMRLSSHLREDIPEQTPDFRQPLIIVTDELLPSQVVTLGDTKVSAIVTRAGSQTSHAAIIARSRGIPAVSGITGLMKQVKTGDILVVDGREGNVLVNPDPETLAAYRKLEREFFDLKDQLAANKDTAPITEDGISLELLANVNNVTDAEAAKAMGAAGVGLYRTEYLFVAHMAIPDEEEQFANYKQIIDAAPGNRLTLRTIDIGGDKTVSYLGHGQNEANPFMGWRSIRISFEQPLMFLAQIRAALRAGAYAKKLGGDVRLMFPMITTLEEIRRVRRIVEKAVRQLDTQEMEFARVDIGMMLEVPAAAVMLSNMLGLVDFVSIGSNDLVQYLMAADRDNPKVSHLCQPLSPAVLATLAHVIKTCNDHRVPVTLCGEMAGQNGSFILLLGMGLRSFSMSPAFVPTIKDLASHVSQAEAESILSRALRLKTTADVKRLMRDQVKRLAPDLALLDLG